MVDVHPTWSGPCEMMFPTYKALSTSIDDFEKRLDFIMVCFIYAGDLRDKSFLATAREIQAQEREGKRQIQFYFFKKKSF